MMVKTSVIVCWREKRQKRREQREEQVNQTAKGKDLFTRN